MMVTNCHCDYITKLKEKNTPAVDDEERTVNKEETKEER
jgi:hypothetical protein